MIIWQNIKKNKYIKLILKVINPSNIHVFYRTEDIISSIQFNEDTNLRFSCFYGRGKIKNYYEFTLTVQVRMNVFVRAAFLVLTFVLVVRVIT